jgi:hypothetical protein
MKKAIVFNFFALILLASCVSPMKYQNIVDSKVREFLNVKPVSTGDSLIISVQKLPAGDSLVKIKKIRNLFIPAIVFWFWENTLQCEIDPRTVGEKIAHDIAQHPELSKKMKGNKLELSIEAVPNEFIYSHKGYVLFVMFYAFSGESETIVPVWNDLRVKYWITEPGAETIKGTIIVADKNAACNNIWKTAKKFTWFYLEDYEINLKKMSNECTEKLIRIIAD